MSKLLAKAIVQRKQDLLSSNQVANLSHKFPSHFTFEKQYFAQEKFGTDEFFKAIKNGFDLNVYYYYAGPQVENFIQHEKVLHAVFMPYENEYSFDDELSIAEIEKAISENKKVDMCSLSSMELLMDLGEGLFCFINMNSDSKCGGIAYFKTLDSKETVLNNFKNRHKSHAENPEGKVIEVSGQYLKDCPFDGSPYGYNDEWFLKAE